MIRPGSSVKRRQQKTKTPGVSGKQKVSQSTPLASLSNPHSLGGETSRSIAVSVR